MAHIAQALCMAAGEEVSEKAQAQTNAVKKHGEGDEEGAHSAQLAPSISDSSFEPGTSSSFMFTDPRSGREDPLRVHYHIPTNFDNSNPIIFVMHGVNRDAANYMERWCKRADSHRFALVVPEFSLDQFPTRASYNSGNVFRREDPARVRRRAEWAFTVIETVFDLFVKATGSSESGYYMYGHSAGAQFVHRYVAFMGAGGRELRLKAAVCANAGWYTTASFDTRFPYGFGGTDKVFNEADMVNFLQAPLILLLGGADTDPNHKHLNKGKEAMLQGDHRLARGAHFYKVAMDAAQARGVELEWKIFIVHDVGHSDSKMRCAAVSHLFKPRAAAANLNKSFTEIFLEPLDVDGEDNIDDDDEFSGADLSGVDYYDTSDQGNNNRVH